MLPLPQIFTSIQDVFFDMDGTLVDSIPFHQEAWLRFLGNKGIHLRPEDFQAQNHGTIKEMIHRFFPHEKSIDKRRELGEEKEITYRKIYAPHLKEIQGLRTFLNYLRQKKIRIHLSTMGDQNNIDFTLDGLEIRNLFQTITGGHEVFKGKPAPEIFLKSLEKSGAIPDQSIVFEDSGSGIRAALSSGLPVIGIASSHSKKELLEMGCIAAFRDFEEVLNSIK